MALLINDEHKGAPTSGDNMRVAEIANLNGIIARLNEEVDDLKKENHGLKVELRTLKSKAE